MPKRKLTARLKDFLYENRFKAKLSDYDGEALTYLRRLRASSKAAKKRKESTAKVGDTTIPRNSEIYHILNDAAKLKKMPVSKFIKKYKKEVDQFMRDGKIVIPRETSYAINDINKLPARSKIFINGEQVSKGDAIYALQSFTSSAMQYTETVVVNYELSYDLKGNLYLILPTEEEIEEAEQNEELYYELLEDQDGLDAIISSGKGGKKKK